MEPAHALISRVNKENAGFRADIQTIMDTANAPDMPPVHRQTLSKLALDISDKHSQVCEQLLSRALLNIIEPSAPRGFHTSPGPNPKPSSQQASPDPHPNEDSSNPSDREEATLPTPLQPTKRIRRVPSTSSEDSNGDMDTTQPAAPVQDSPAQETDDDVVEADCSDQEFDDCPNTDSASAEADGEKSWCDGTDPENTSPGNTTVFISDEHELSGYRQRRLAIAGMEFPSMAVALAYFVGQYHGNSHTESRRLANWIRLARNAREALERTTLIYERLPSVWLDENVPKVAVALLTLVCRQDESFGKALADVPNSALTLLHAGTDRHLAANVTEPPRSDEQCTGRNLFGCFMLFHKARPNSDTLVLSELLPALYPAHAKFLVVDDEVCSGLVGDAYTTARTIPGLMAHCNPNHSISAAHAVPKIRHFDKFAAVVLIIGRSHIGDYPRNIQKNFSTMLTSFRKETAAPILILGPPPSFKSRRNAVMEAVRQIQKAADEFPCCRFIDLAMVLRPPQKIQKFVNPATDQLTSLGRLRTIVAAMGHIPQLALRST